MVFAFVIIAVLVVAAVHNPRATMLLCLVGVGGCTAAYVVAPSGLRAGLDRMAAPPEEWSAILPSWLSLDDTPTFVCPGSPNLPETIQWGEGASEGVWGTEVYTWDSHVCWAAVHVGVIDVASGGTVRLEVVPGHAHYPGTSRHGVTTETWVATDGWDNSRAYRVLGTG